jgi:hypothetical protein
VTFDYSVCPRLKRFDASQWTRRALLNAIDTLAEYHFDTELLKLALESVAETGLERLANKNVAGMDKCHGLAPFVISRDLSAEFHL